MSGAGKVESVAQFRARRGGALAVEAIWIIDVTSSTSSTSFTGRFAFREVYRIMAERTRRPGVSLNA